MVFETLVCSLLNHLTRLIAREHFIILSRRESNKSHNIKPVMSLLFNIATVEIQDRDLPIIMYV